MEHTWIALTVDSIHIGITSFQTISHFSVQRFRLWGFPFIVRLVIALEICNQWIHIFNDVVAVDPIEIMFLHRIGIVIHSDAIYCNLLLFFIIFTVVWPLFNAFCSSQRSYNSVSMRRCPITTPHNREKVFPHCHRHLVTLIPPIIRNGIEYKDKHTHRPIPPFTDWFLFSEFRRTPFRNSKKQRNIICNEALVDS